MNDPFPAYCLYCNATVKNYSESGYLAFNGANSPTIVLCLKCSPPLKASDISKLETHIAKRVEMLEKQREDENR